MKYAGCKIIFFDAGTYIVTSTLTIPAGTQLVGEAWSVIAGSGSAFQDQANPQVVVRAGDTNSQGILEISDIIFATVGPSMLVTHVILLATHSLCSCGCDRARVEHTATVGTKRWCWHVGFTYQVKIISFDPAKNVNPDYGQAGRR